MTDVGHGLAVGADVFFPTDDPDAFAAEHRRLGYRAAVCPDMRVSDTARIDAVAAAFARHGVVIAEVGAWRNMLTPDDEVRRENLAYVTHQMALAEAVGALCCVNVAGSFDGATLSGPHPRNLGQGFFDATVENVRAILDAVKPTRSFFTLEMKGWNLPDGPESYLALIKAVDRAAFAVHMDVFNAINSPYRYYGSGAFIRECFRILGPWVKSCHGKDLIWQQPEKNVVFKETVPGRGGVDYGALLSELAKTGAPLILEHLTTTADYQEGFAYVRRVAASVGVAIA